MKMFEFESVTTRGGDSGDTSLYDGSRLGKDRLIFDLLGNLDELNSWLGVVRSHFEDPAAESVSELQKLLLVIGAEIATPVKSPQYAGLRRLAREDILRLEELERDLMKKTRIPDGFILPGKSRVSSFIDVARTVARRTERSLVRHIRENGVKTLSDPLVFLNRLSDYLFVLARYSEQREPGEW